MKRLIDRYNSLPLKQKLNAVVGMIIGCMLVINIVIISQFYCYSVKISNEGIVRSMDQCARIIGQDLQAIEKDVYYKTTQAPFLNLQLSPGEGIDDAANLLKYRTAAEYILQSDEQFQFVFYCDNNGVATRNCKKGGEAAAAYLDKLADPAACEKEAAELKNLWGGCGWESLDIDTAIVKRAVYNSRLRYIGFIMIGLDTALLKEHLTEIMPADCQAAVYSKADNLILTNFEPDTSNPGQKPFMDSGEAMAEGGLYRIAYSYSHTRLTGAMKSSLMMSMFCTLGVTALTACISLWISQSFTSRINILLEHTKRVSMGDFEASVPVNTHDEIGQLMEHFNQMISHVRILMEENQQKSVRQSQIEYQLLEQKYMTLQSQLNPHFLYNAFEMINGMAKIQNAPEVSRMICTLSELLRASLNRTEKEIPLSREIAYIRRYMTLNEMMYGSRLETEFILSPETEDLLVPAFILQPLVENSILYGLSEMIGTCKITVRSTLKECLYIEVADNGPGFEKSVMDMLNHEIVQNEQRTHIGIRNIKERIKLLYGDPYGLVIRSTPGATVITLRLPGRHGSCPAEEMLPQGPQPE